MAKRQAKKEVVVEVHEVRREVLKITLVGTSPLIVHNFSAKARGQMLAKQCKVTWPKEPKHPVRQFEAATYYITEDGMEIPSPADLSLVYEGKVKEFIALADAHVDALRALKKPRFGFPSVGFKASAIRGAKSLGLVMADMKGAMLIPPEFVEIKGKRRMRSDMVRISHSTSDIRFRPEFWPWEATFDVIFNAAIVTPDIIINMFKAAGFCCGVGEWRPGKGGSKGMFDLKNSA